eukprot:Pgem_evm1s7132
MEAALISETDEYREGKLTHAMDIFGLGCLIAELFLDGTPLFSFSQLLAYRNFEYEPKATID